MILLGLIFAGLITGIGLWFFANKTNHYHDTADSVAVCLNFVFGCIAVLAVIILALIHISTPAFVERDKARYEMLTYQWENDFYDNDNDVGKQELVDQIREWNEYLAAGKRMQHDIWVGAFVPDVFDQFEFISLDGNPRPPEVKG